MDPTLRGACFQMPFWFSGGVVFSESSWPFGYRIGFKESSCDMNNHLRNEKYPSCLGCIRDCTTQFYGDYSENHELRIPSLNNQDDHGKSPGPRVFWTVAHLVRLVTSMDVTSTRSSGCTFHID